MQKGALVLMVAVTGAFAAGIVNAQPIARRELTPAPVDQVALLEKRIAVLEQQNAELRRFVVISGDTITVKAPDTLNLEAAKNLSMRAGAAVLVKSSTELRLDAATALRLRGATINLNNGTKPLGTSPTITTD